MSNDKELTIHLNTKNSIFFYSGLQVLTTFYSHGTTTTVKLYNRAITLKYYSTSLCIQAFSLILAHYKYGFVFCLHSFTSFRMPYKWINTVCSPLNLFSFHLHYAFEVHACCVYQEIFPFYCWIVFDYIDIPKLIHSVIEGYLVGFKLLIIIWRIV